MLRRGFLGALVTVGILLVGSIATAGVPETGGPEDPFIGSGEAVSTGPDCFYEIPVTLLVTKSEAGWIASVQFDMKCIYGQLMQTTSSSHAFFLNGDWESGFSGFSPGSLSVMTIAPYGNGTDIEFRIFFWWQVCHPCGYLLQGKVDNADMPGDAPREP